MKEEKNYLTLIDEKGEETLAEILFTHFSEEFNKHYVVFQIEGEDSLAAAIYEPNDSDEQGKLSNIESDEEWDMIEDLLQQFYGEEDELSDFDEIEEDEEEGHNCSCGHHHCSCEDDEDDEEHECSCEDDECECHHH